MAGKKVQNWGKNQGKTTNLHGFQNRSPRRNRQHTEAVWCTSFVGHKSSFDLQVEYGCPHKISGCPQVWDLHPVIKINILYNNAY